MAWRKLPEQVSEKFYNDTKTKLRAGLKDGTIKNVDDLNEIRIKQAPKWIWEWLKSQGVKKDENNRSIYYIDLISSWAESQKIDKASTFSILRSELNKAVLEIAQEELGVNILWEEVLKAKVEMEEFHRKQRQRQRELNKSKKQI